MIPSDQFVRFYNEVFKFLERQGEEALQEYFLDISRQQEAHCLELFRKQGLAGMKAYWDRIAIEENCDMSCTLRDGLLEIEMHQCPSLGKALDNDAGASPRYCDHCPGWIIPLLHKAGFACEYDIIDHRLPRCRLVIYPLPS